MGLFRSEEMCSGTILLPVDRARHFIDLIGRYGNLQFMDMHRGRSAPKRAYKRYVQRIDEMERILRFLFEELKTLGATVLANNIDGFLEYDYYYKLEGVEQEVLKANSHFKEFKANHTKLLQARQKCIEERYVLEVAAMSSWSVPGRRSSRKFSAQSIDIQEAEEGDFIMGGGEFRQFAHFSHIAGVVSTNDAERFSRFLFRSTRGNTFTLLEHIPTPIMNPTTGKEVQKSVFAVHFQDVNVAGGSAMYQRIMRACKQFNVATYPWVTDPGESNRKISELKNLLLEKECLFKGYNQFLDDSKAHLLEKQMSGNSLVEDWRLFCSKEKAIYATLNFFDGDTALHCDIWYPKVDEETMQGLLQQNCSHESIASIVTDHTVAEQPPTYFISNELTAAAQTLIHTYGVPRYRELTPVIFSVVTFPFIFGVMFGDVGHGLLLMCAGGFLILNAEFIKKTIPALYQFRYMIFMMGFFSTYAGLMYNDFMSLGMELFESRWEHTATKEMAPLTDITNGIEPLANPKFSGPYPFGIDSAWHGADNELSFVNSFKMKFSVIVGVCQMFLGLIMRCFNAYHERSVLDFFGECVPMIIFFMSFFGYMDYMIVYKWVTAFDWPGAPGIINNLISMAMFGSITTTEDSEGNIVPVELFSGEKEYENNLMFWVMITIPWILLVKPVVITYRQYRISRSGAYQPLGMMDGEKDPQAKGKKRIDLGDLWIHQIIETIEYVLGSVSHTASYLRLWALSLAHQQLSFVLFGYSIGAAMSAELSFPISGIIIALTFGFFLVITVVKFLFMDVMECFLHTLRLHWVEFQSKFYHADGYAFEPYNHHAILESSSDD
eukprot:GEMP01013677.1.p1 GENE.GEMP01013677.1~~GEMP01013677.1.p1  ORF type:complete len:835 (+),score=115.77 GEMP01013677.1:324-2828(+)